MKELSSKYPKGEFWGMKRDIAKAFEEKRENRGKGMCWFCPGLCCPFSESELDKLDADAGSDSRERKLPPMTREALISIYEECGKDKTHEPRRA